MIIKHKPEDFQVFEKANLPFKENGGFSYCLMWKKKMTTIDAIHEIAKFLHIDEKKIGFAGTKDKVAITEQYISIKDFDKESIEKFHNDHIILSYLGSGDYPLSLGDLEGNNFIITIRDLAQEEIDLVSKKLKEAFVFMNFFGEQRFSEKNTDIGKNIIKKKYKEAVNILLELGGKHEHKVKKYIAEYPTDYVGALKTIPRKILLMYIHAYQSLLWNEYANQIDEDEIPIVGFDTQLNEKETLIKKILIRENIILRDFINPSFPELTVEGTTRKKWCNANVSYEVLIDEMFNGKKKMILKFFLPKGCYATELCKQLFA